MGAQRQGKAHGKPQQQPGGGASDPVHADAQLRFPRPEEGDHKIEGGQDEDHAEFLGQRGAEPAVGDPVEAVQPHKADHTQPGQEPALAAALQERQQDGGDHGILDQPEQPQHRIRRDTQHCRQIVQHTVHAHGVDARNVELIVDQTVDPIVVNRQIRRAKAPVVEDPRPADLPQNPEKDRQKHKIRPYLFQQPHQLPPDEAKKPLYLPQAMMHKTPEPQFPEDKMPELLHQLSAVRPHRDLIDANRDDPRGHQRKQQQGAAAGQIRQLENLYQMDDVKISDGEINQKPSGCREGLDLSVKHQRRQQNGTSQIPAQQFHELKCIQHFHRHICVLLLFQTCPGYVCENDPADPPAAPLHPLPAAYQTESEFPYKYITQMVAKETHSEKTPVRQLQRNDFA